MAESTSLRDRYLLLACLGVCAGASAPPAIAQTFTPLWSFGSGTDGALPAGSLAGTPAAIYGVTLAGGTSRLGTVYAVNQAGQERVLHSFTNGADGGLPSAGLTKVGDTLYGTNQIGGSTGNGVVFAINSKTGAETTIYSFTGGTDGGSPLGGVIYRNGYLFGTAFLGGTFGDGTAFRIKLLTGEETTLHAFGGGIDGNSPEGNLIFANGLLYGATEVGGTTFDGTLYFIDPRTGAETVIYNLLAARDGRAPQAGPILKNGIFYDTCTSGGTAGDGTVFAFDPATGRGGTIHNFRGGSDGIGPLTSVTAVGDTLYGAANDGGTFGDGILFSMALNGSAYTVVHAFTGGPDGEFPQSPLLFTGGALYGTANVGGPNTYGTAFKLSP